MLQLTNVTKSYTRRGRTVHALNQVSARFEKGDFISIIGPSGSGKSTLLLILGAMLSPSSGDVEIAGKVLGGLSVTERATLRRERIGFVFQNFNLVPYLTALENVQVPLLLHGMSPGEQVERASSLLESVGLGSRLDHKPCELSIGQQQRVALARMLANEPEIILADEPTGNLDPATGEQVLEFLEQQCRDGRTVVMVTHDMRAAARAHRTLRLEEGILNDHPAPVGA